MRQPKPLTEIKTGEIRAEWKSLKKMTKSDLKMIVGRNYRVVDLAGCGKYDLMNMIMSAHFSSNWGDAIN